MLSLHYRWANNGMNDIAHDNIERISIIMPLCAHLWQTNHSQYSLESCFTVFTLHWTCFKWVTYITSEHMIMHSTLVLWYTCSFLYFIILTHSKWFVCGENNLNLPNFTHRKDLSSFQVDIFITNEHTKFNQKCTSVRN